ncbi:MAG: DUF1513 domain-containing protein [Pseudomonadota bacterium]
MTTRRAFLAGAAAASLAPAASWSDVGSPTYLSAAMTPESAYRLYGIGEDLDLVFSVPLPGRGHAAAAHPHRPEAVAFARRPGVFALVIDCREGRADRRLEAPPERHFYGHGAFSQDGARLYTTENAFEEGHGVIGVWAANEGYRRIGEFPSGGVGPHDILHLPGSETLVVANGGIDTHPETGREKLNLPTMRSNISFISPTGRIDAIWETPEDQRLNSMRHLAAREDGLIAIGCQWQGDVMAGAPLVGMCRHDAPLNMLDCDRKDWRAMHGYIGGVSFANGGDGICVTAPRGKGMARFALGAAKSVEFTNGDDICGVATAKGGVVISDGAGLLQRLSADPLQRRFPLTWDNHLVRRG